MSEPLVYAILPGWFLLVVLLLLAFGLFEAPLLRWLERWHGHPEPWQAQFYRCQGCRRVVTHSAIARGGCGCRLPGCGRVNPTALWRREKLAVLLLPWLYSPWPWRRTSTSH